MRTKAHNGYSNWYTWNAYTWLTDNNIIPNFNEWLDEALATQPNKLADKLKNLVRDSMPDEAYNMGFYGDLIGYGVDQIDWLELAEKFDPEKTKSLKSRNGIKDYQGWGNQFTWLVGYIYEDYPEYLNKLQRDKKKYDTPEKMEDYLRSNFLKWISGSMLPEMTNGLLELAKDFGETGTRKKLLEYAYKQIDFKELAEHFFEEEMLQQGKSRKFKSLASNEYQDFANIYTWDVYRTYRDDDRLTAIALRTAQNYSTQKDLGNYIRKNLQDWLETDPSMADLEDRFVGYAEEDGISGKKDAKLKFAVAQVDAEEVAKEWLSGLGTTKSKKKLKAEMLHYEEGDETEKAISYKSAKIYLVHNIRRGWKFSVEIDGVETDQVGYYEEKEDALAEAKSYVDSPAVLSSKIEE